MFVPSKFARWILSVPKFVQYILPPSTSNAIPAGVPNPAVTRSSTFVLPEFTRWILLFVYCCVSEFHVKLVQYIGGASNLAVGGGLLPLVPARVLR